MMEPVYSGIDTGSNKIKIVNKRVGDKIEVITTSSTWCEAPENIWSLEFQKGAAKELAKNMVLKYNNKNYLFGDLAREQVLPKNLVEPINGNILTDVYKDNKERTEEDLEKARVTIKGVLGLIVKDKVYDEDIKMKICTGVPIETSKELRREIKNLFVGRHVFSVCNIMTGEEYTRNIEVKDCLVISEPLGTFYDMLFDYKGNVIDKALASKSIGVLDIGWATTCSYRLEESRAIGIGCKTSTRAMKEFSYEVASKVMGKFKVSITPIEVDEALRKGYIKINGKKIKKEFKEAVNETAQEFTKTILVDIKNNFLQKGGVEEIVLTGGGAEVFYPYIKKAAEVLKERHDMMPRIVKPENPEMSNAQGFCKRASSI